MKKFEITTAVIALVAVGLKFLHIPGANMLMMLSFGSLAIFYCICTPALLNDIPFSMDLLKNSRYNDPNNQMLGTTLEVFVARLTGYSFAVVILGILFKILSLEGANFMLMAGLISLFIIAIVAIVKYIKTRSQFYSGILIRSVIIVGIGLSIFVLSLIKYINSPENIVYNKGRNLYGLNIAKNSSLEKIIVVEGYMDTISLYRNRSYKCCGITWNSTY